MHVGRVSAPMHKPRVILALSGLVSGWLLLPVSPAAWSQIPPHLLQPYKQALHALDAGRYGEAVAGLQALIQANPEFSRAYHSLVEAYVYQDSLAAGEAYFRSQLRANPRNAYVHYALGRLAYSRGAYDQARTHLQTAIELAPTYVEPYTRRGLPEIYRAQKQLDAGARYFQRRIEADPQNACSYLGLGRIYMRQYDLPQAEKLLTQALERDPELVRAHHSLVAVFFTTSRYDEALRHSEILLQLATKQDDFEGIAYAWMIRGNCYFLQGDYARAVTALQNGLATARESGDKQRQAACLNTLAAIHALSANFPKALQYFRESLRLAQKTGSKFNEVQSLGNIANVYKDQGDIEQALTYYQKALALAQQNHLKREESANLTNLAEIYQQRGDLERAVNYQKKALAIAKSISEQALQAYALRNLGTLYQDLGRDALAIEHLERALAIGVATGDVQIIWESQAALGTYYEQQHQPNRAIAHYQKAIALYDSVRNRLDIEALQTSFLEDKYQAYPSLVRLLARSGDVAAAFAYAEKYKAKTLLDLLSQGRNLFNPMLADSLTAKLRAILSQLEETHRSVALELARAEPDQQKIMSLDQTLTDLELQRATLAEKLRARHGAVFQLAAPDILRLEEVQRRVLQEREALVEYLLGADRLAVFVIRPDTAVYREIPLRGEELQDQLRQLSPIFDGNVTQPLLNAELASFSLPPAHALYRTLIEPIRDDLADAERLIIVPDDLLFYLPFEMLVTDTTDAVTPYDFGNAHYLSLIHI